MAKRKRVRITNQRRGDRLIGYIRVSDTRGREEKLIAHKVQEADILRWADQNNYTIVHWISDLNKTGTESEHRDVAKAINMVEAGIADGIAVRKLDRWGRNEVDSWLNILELQSVGGHICSTSEDLNNIDTPSGKFSLTVILAVAEMFSAEMAKTWRSIHQYRRELGKPAHGGLRLGYLRKKDIPEDEQANYYWPENSDYTIDSNVAPRIEQAVNDYLAGKPLERIVAEMNAAGVRTTHGRAFTYLSFKKTLVSGFYAGLLFTERNGEPEYLKGAQEPIVSEEKFWEFLGKLHDGSAPRNKHAPRRLTRLVYCTGCGLRMQTRRDRRDIIWFCGRRSNKVGSEYCAAPARIQEQTLEKEVHTWLLEHAEGQAALNAQTARARKVIQGEKDVANIDRAIARERKRLSVLGDMLLDGRMPAATGRIKEEEITNAIARLESSRRAMEGDVKVNSLPDVQVFGALMAGWEAMDPAIFNEGLHKVIQRVEVSQTDEFYGRSKMHIVSRWDEASQLQGSARRASHLDGGGQVLAQ